MKIELEQLMEQLCCEKPEELQNFSEVIVRQGSLKSKEGSCGDRNSRLTSSLPLPASNQFT
ncbi:hypothetical protein [Chryseobacterium sp. Leaf201]|uniref:hypothetical protein n=1 Tax=Chryseobacterium sp. Leaf201 TaxID=1735672 RepID=UPI000A539145|nr:hypothetical protein [Chryseobacterium sp. Leaf201]